jgi:hypothetical protein
MNHTKRYCVGGIIVGWLLGFCCGWICNAQEVEHVGSDLLRVSDDQHSLVSPNTQSLWDSEELFAAPGIVRSPKPATPIKRDFHSYLQSSFTRRLIVADYSVRILDAVSTRQFMNNPCRCIVEKQIGPIAGSAWGMTAYSLGVATAVEYGAYKLWQHGHPRIARVLQIGEIGYDGYFGVNNERLNAQH